MRIDRRTSGALVAITGASQSGKTTWLADELHRSRRLLVWDYKGGEWGLRYQCRRLSTFDELAAASRSSAPPERLAFYARGMNRDAFSLFCRFAFVWLQRAPGDLVVEETASVTSSGKAPDAWGDVCRMGLGFGANIYAVTQRPAESDKTALGNASLVHCHRMHTEDDIRYMSKLLRVEFAQIDALLDYQWIERASSGLLRFGGPGLAQKTIRPAHMKHKNAGDGRRPVATSRR